MTTESPLALRRFPSEAAVRPLPNEEATPPVTNTCLTFPELTAMELQSITRLGASETRHDFIFGNQVILLRARAQPRWWSSPRAFGQVLPRALVEIAGSRSTP